mgnify:CR=1 FL=1|jgi:hypothetical protein
MENLFIKLKIVKDLSKIILGYLTKSQYNLLNKRIELVDKEEIILFDSKLLVCIMKYLDDKNKIFELCTKFGKLKNMKWLFKKKIPYNEKIFMYAAKNGNLKNMKWLYKNKFPYNRMVFAYTAEIGNLKNMKWLFKKKFPYNSQTFALAAKNGNLENMK